MSKVVRLNPPRRTDALLQAMTEKQWQGWVIRVAKQFGWFYYHPYDSRKSVPGYPDLTLLRERTIFVELKTEHGTLSKEQEKWRDRIQACSGVEYYLWRPRHWRKVVETLQHRQTWRRKEAA